MESSNTYNRSTIFVHLSQSPNKPNEVYNVLDTPSVASVSLDLVDIYTHLNILVFTDNEPI